MSNKKTLAEMFREYEVEAESAEDFCNKYHKPFPNEKFYQEQRREIIKSLQTNLDEKGFAIIPHHNTNSGVTVSWHGGKKTGVKTLNK